jgi:hypothetical protein
MKFLKPIFLVLVLIQLSLSIWCYVDGLFSFMENTIIALQIGFILLGLSIGLAGLGMISRSKSKGSLLTGWILFGLSSGFAIFMMVQNIKLILHPPEWHFG